MALLRYSFYSKALEMETSVNVILPFWDAGENRDRFDAGIKFPTVYLLHGLGEDESAWQRFTAVEQHAMDLGFAIVMPSGGRSFYVNSVKGNYSNYISIELPHHMRKLLPLSSVRKDNFIAGLSMGGYGAFRTAMLRPGEYAAAASLSGALDAVALAETERSAARIIPILGKPEEIRGTDRDLLFCAEKLVKTRRTDMPKFYMCCGTDDLLFDLNAQFYNKLSALRLNVEFHKDRGAHDWKFWNEWIRKALSYFKTIDN